MTFKNLYQVKSRSRFRVASFILSGFFFLFIFSSTVHAEEGSGELIYKQLSTYVNNGDNEFIAEINVQPRYLDWSNAEQLDFKGHLRFLNSPLDGGRKDQTMLFFIRSAAEGNIYILNIPDRENQDYVGLEELIESKLIFSIEVIDAEIAGESYSFARFVTVPVQPAFDKIFRLAIILMLFLVMVGMGLTLTGRIFLLLFPNQKVLLLERYFNLGLCLLLPQGLDIFWDSMNTIHTFTWE